MASPSLSNRNADRDQEIITCYEKSGDIALLYLQEVEKVSPNVFTTVLSCFFLIQMYIDFVAEDSSAAEGQPSLRLISFCPTCEL